MTGGAPLEAIFPSIRAGVLSAALLEPRRWWFMSELARHLGSGPSSLQRELESLVNSGILERREDGRRVYFRANASSPVFRDLRGLVEKTAGVTPTLSIALESFGDRIELAFVYGSLARGEERALSDVDLMVVGSVRQIDLVPVLRKLEDRLGRAVNATLYAPQEFRRRLAAGDHFLSSVLKGKTILLKGSLDELDKTPTRRKGAPAPNQRAGTRRDTPARSPRSG
ncbi:MAG: nucleotidyltransferase domain-containing protein [Terracidiphilus sp.]|nr:nucleotidyltransferase domain-containing protein [Terracidiphilus sp.]